MTLNSIIANFQTFKLVDLLDILVIAFLIYQLLGIVNRTRAGQLAKGALLVLVVYLVVLAAVMIWIQPIWGIAAIVEALVVFGYYHHIAMKYFGGTTGDISGFFLCICEAGMAVVLAVVSNLFVM